MKKEELLTLLRDPDICHEIFLMVKNCGQPSVSAARPAEPTPTEPKLTTSRLAAIKEKLQKARAGQTAAEPAERSEEKSASVREMLRSVPASDSPATEDPSEGQAPNEGIQGMFSDKLAFLRSHVQKATEERLAEEKRAEEQKQVQGNTHGNLLYTLERTCPVCGQTTRVVKYKSRLNAERTDADLCIHYKDFNPYLYRIWACEHCGYAADERRFIKPMPERTQEKLYNFLHEADLAMPFIEERSTETAVSYIQMAILFSELADPSLNRRAGLYLTMAWIYRYDGDDDKEQEALGKAVELYEQSLDTEGYPVDKMSDSMATYLTGAIHFMRKDYDRATPHLSRIISNRDLKTSAPQLYEKARDMWQEIKRIRQA